MAVERIGTEGVDLLTMRASELEGSIIDGRGGEDILELTGGAFGVEFDFRSATLFTGIERIRGISFSHSVVFSSEQLQGIKSFENPNRGSFILRIEGSNVDLRNKTLESGVEVNVQTDGATLTVSNMQVASMVTGHDAVGETLIVEGIELTAAERRMLHSHGIDRVQDATGAISEDLGGPSISGLATRIAVSPGIRVHPAAQVSVSEDIGLFSMSVLLDRPAWGVEELIIDQSGPVRIVGDEWQAHITVNGRVVAEAYLAFSALYFHFKPEATVADVQELLRSIVYQASGAAMPALPNKLKVELIDLAQNRTQAEIGINYANQAPTEILLDDSTIPSDAGGDWGTFLHATDPNYGETFAFTLIDDANGQFALRQDGPGVILYLAKPLASQETFAITVRVTDHGGLHFDRSFLLSAYVEEGDDDLILGTARDDRLSGSKYSNEIYGYGGNDILTGNGGNDDLYGGLGRDTLIGGSGADGFVFNTKVASKRNTNIDRLNDFDPKKDTVFLDTSVFTKIEYTGRLSKQAFWNGSKAHDTSDRVIYHKATGSLFYDPDGSGKKSAIKIAILPSKLKLSHYDFSLL